MPIIKASARTKVSAFVSSIWDNWCDITSRPKELRTPLPSELRGAIASAAEAGFSHDDISNATIYAAYSKPSSDRRADKVRLLRVLSDPDAMNRVYDTFLLLSARDVCLDDYLGHGPYLHPQAPAQDFDWSKASAGEAVAPDGADRIAEIADILRVPVHLWPLSQMPYAIELSPLPNVEIQRAADEVRVVTGLNGVLPVDAVRALSDSFHVETPLSEDECLVGNEDMYLMGVPTEKEREWRGGSLRYLSLDEEATRAIRRGLGQEEVAKFHNLAPEGYWERYDEMIGEGLSRGESEERLAEEFDGWKPSDRADFF